LYGSTTGGRFVAGTARERDAPVEISYRDDRTLAAWGQFDRAHDERLT